MIGEGEEGIVVGISGIGVQVVADAVDTLPEGIVLALIHDMEEVSLGQ